MDDLLALLEADPGAESSDTETKQEQCRLNQAISRPNPLSGYDLPRLPPQPRPPSSPPPAACCSVDTKVGIRMLNRRISGAELLDLVVTNPFHSAPAIASMSTAALNRLLVDPASTVLNRTSTVCGPTNLVTVSVVLSNSGTKISSNSGNAYCILTLGTLSSGPAVSVMLFGAAYTEHVRTCAPGKVVALICPRLAPAKSERPSAQATNYSTTVLFSVQNTEQCQVVADARDFGRCKAKVKSGPPAYSKRNYNADEFSDQSIAIPKQCKCVIDTRQGEYCPLHRKLALQTKGSTGAPAMSKLLADSKAFHGSRVQTKTIKTGSGKTLTLPSNHQMKQNGNRQLQQHPARSNAVAVMSSTRPAATTIFGQQAKPAIVAGQQRPIDAQNSILYPSQGGNGDSKRMAMRSTLTTASNMVPPMVAGGGNRVMNQAQPINSSKAAALLGNTSRTVSTTTLPLLINPYGVINRRPPMQTSKSTSVSNQNTSVESSSVLTDWLHPQGRRVSLATDKKKQSIKTSGRQAVCKGRRINIDSSHRDGTVLVPKPSNMFTKDSLSGKIAPCVSRASHPLPQKRAVEDLLMRQQVVAQQLQRTASMVSAAAGNVNATKTPMTQIASREALLFGVIPDGQDLETIVATKSKYESEALAEEYTRSRNRVMALDQQENKSQNKSKTKEGPIEKTWHCLTCKKDSKVPPVMCRRRGHIVKLRRSIQNEKKSVDEQRKASSEASDGLILGQGLEWSRWNN